jgi:hypothetical protein
MEPLDGAQRRSAAQTGIGRSPDYSARSARFHPGYKATFVGLDPQP